MAAAAAGGNVSVGSEIAGSAQSYNRKLHVLEKERLSKEAANLDSTVGKSKTGISWSILLEFASGGQIDEEDNAQLQAILSSYGKTNPEGIRVASDLTLAGEVVKQLQSEKVLLTFADGTPIVANGEKVYAFTSTSNQYKDSQLFNSTSNTTLVNSPDGLGVVPDKWIDQYGESVATKRLREIGAISSDAELSADQWRMFREYATGGLNSNIDLELLVEMLPPGKATKGTLLAVLKELVTRDALAKAEKTALEKRLIELNATRDAEGFGQSAQRDFVPGMEHRAENINAGQVTDRDGLPRIDDEKKANDLLLKSRQVE